MSGVGDPAAPHFGSALGAIGVASVSLLTLVAMLCTVTAAGAAFRLLFGPGQTPIYVLFSVNDIVAGVFGGVLAARVRTGGVRVALFASLFLALCFAVPAVAGNPHSQAPLVAWINLWSAIPAMCIGAGLYQARRLTRNA